MIFKNKRENTEWGWRTYYTGPNDSVRFALYAYDDDPKTLYFSNLFVDPKHRGHKLGDEVLDYVENIAKLNSYESIILNVKKDSWVRDWYEKRGFEYMEDCGDDYSGNVWMRMDLTSR